MSTPVPIGYVAAATRRPPVVAIDHARVAAKAGFDGVLVSDHFQPHLPAHGHAGNVWALLGAIGTAVDCPVVGVTTPGYRTHPATVAQAAATVANICGDRFMLGVGSGEAINEHVVGEHWPYAPDRVARMFEAVELITKLLTTRNRDVRHSGKHFTLGASRLWETPEVAPPIVVATSGAVTARRAGRVADGLLTVQASPERLENLLRRFREGAAQSGRDPAALTTMVRLDVAWAPDESEAMRLAMQNWPQGGLHFSTADVRSPFDIAQMVRHVRPEDLASQMLVSADLDRHRQYLQGFADLGFDRIFVHHVGVDDPDFITAYAREVLGKVIS